MCIDCVVCVQFRTLTAADNLHFLNLLSFLLPVNYCIQLACQIYFLFSLYLNQLLLLYSSVPAITFKLQSVNVLH